MSKIQLLICLLFVTGGAVKAAASPDVKQEALAEMADELSSPAIRESTSYKPHTGDAGLDKILSLLHESFMATNRGDIGKAKIYTAQAKELIDKWKARVQSEATEKSGNQ